MFGLFSFHAHTSGLVILTLAAGIGMLQLWVCFSILVQKGWLYSLPRRIRPCREKEYNLFCKQICIWMHSVLASASLSDRSVRLLCGILYWLAVWFLEIRRGQVLVQPIGLFVLVEKSMMICIPSFAVSTLVSFINEALLQCQTIIFPLK